MHMRGTVVACMPMKAAQKTHEIVYCYV